MLAARHRHHPADLNFPRSRNFCVNWGADQLGQQHTHTNIHRRASGPTSYSTPFDLTGALTKIVERRRSSKEGRKEGRKQQSKGGGKEGKDLMEEKTKSNMTLGLSLWVPQTILYRRRSCYVSLPDFRSPRPVGQGRFKNSEACSYSRTFHYLKTRHFFPCF